MTKITSKIVNDRQILTIEYRDGRKDTFSPFTFNFAPEIIKEAKEKVNVDLTTKIPEGEWIITN